MLGDYESVKHSTTLARHRKVIVDGKFIEGTAPVTIGKESGQIYVLGSQTYGGTMKVPDWAIAIVKKLYE